MELDEVLGMEVRNSQTERSGTVIGVVEDFPYRSMHQTIEPLAINARPHPTDRLCETAYRELINTFSILRKSVERGVSKR